MSKNSNGINLEDFGFLNTLDQLSKGSFIERDYILTKSVYEIYTEMQRKSFERAFEREYIQLNK